MDAKTVVEGLLVLVLYAAFYFTAFVIAPLAAIYAVVKVIKAALL